MAEPEVSILIVTPLIAGRRQRRQLTLWSFEGHRRVLGAPPVRSTPINDPAHAASILTARISVTATAATTASGLLVKNGASDREQRKWMAMRSTGIYAGNMTHLCNEQCTDKEKHRCTVGGQLGMTWFMNEHRHCQYADQPTVVRWWLQRSFAHSKMPIRTLVIGLFLSRTESWLNVVASRWQFVNANCGCVNCLILPMRLYFQCSNVFVAVVLKSLSFGPQLLTTQFDRRHCYTHNKFEVLSFFKNSLNEAVARQLSHLKPKWPTKFLNSSRIC